jgi:NAD(P)-dependent dehydrogenase (short-subunit alcohol dehydrogenase family)
VLDAFYGEYRESSRDMHVFQCGGFVKITGRSALITGAGRGIGAALALRFAAEKPRGIVVSDIDLDAVRTVAGQVADHGVRAIALRADVAEVDQVTELVRVAQQEFGSLDVVCSNAGIATGTSLYARKESWARAWDVNVMGHVHLAQAVLPGMAIRRDGYLLITASAVGLLGLPGDAPYSVTKHAAVGLAEWLAFTYLPRGVRVSALCPLGVRTDLLMQGVDAGHPSAQAVLAAGPVLEPVDVAEAVVTGLDSERFLILPHPEVARSTVAKATDPDAWIRATAGRRLPMNGADRESGGAHRAVSRHGVPT